MNLPSELEEIVDGLASEHSEDLERAPFSQQSQFEIVHNPSRTGIVVKYGVIGRGEANSGEVRVQLIEEGNREPLRYALASREAYRIALLKASDLHEDNTIWRKTYDFWTDSHEMLNRNSLKNAYGTLSGVK